MPKLWILSGAVAAGLAFCVLATIFVVEHATPSVTEEEMSFTSTSHPGQVQVEGSSIRVHYEWERSTLLIPSVDPQVLALLETARDAGETVTFRLQLNGAHFAADSGLPVFWVRHLRYGKKEFGPFEIKPPWSWRKLLGEQVALLKGIAYNSDGQFNAALSEFNGSLATDALRPAQRGLAMASRAYVYQYKAFTEPTALGRDFLLVRATEDFAAAASLRRDDYSLLTSQAGALIELGAYEDALRLLRRAFKQSAEVHFHAGIVMSDVLRRLGRHAEALRVLDEVGERDQDHTGMVYYYHRGWTQLLLGQNPEAAASFSNGLKTQKSWPWAYVGRACARHGMGDDDAALADLRTAVAMADRSVGKDQEFQAAVRAELRNNIAGLARRAARVPDAPGMSVCEHLQPNFDRPMRERSKLLDKR